MEQAIKKHFYNHGTVRRHRVSQRASKLRNIKLSY